MSDEAPPVQWPVVVKLKRPLDYDGESVASLEFKRGKLGHLKGMKVDGIPSADQIMLLASRMCGQPVKVIESLDPDDSGEVMALALDFFARCLGAGTTL